MVAKPYSSRSRSDHQHQQQLAAVRSSQQEASTPKYELGRNFQFQMFLNIASFKYVDKLPPLPAKDDHLPPPCIRRTPFPPMTHCGMRGKRWELSNRESKKEKTKIVKGVYDRMKA